MKPGSVHARRFLLYGAPLLIVFLTAAWEFRPAGATIPGNGGDPLFTLWELELFWRKWRTHQGLFWAPLYGGHPLGIAFSENQLATALVLWPIRALTGSGPATMCIGAMILVVLAWVTCTLWLRSLGVARLCAWGGVLFALCGWMRGQFTHYQNFCIFLLPLALWMLRRFAENPTASRTIAAALACGCIGWWNLYFQMFVNLFLAATLVLRLRRAPLLVALAVLAELPLLLTYWRLGGDRTMVTYGATLTSLVSREVDVEGSGYIGYAWLALALSALALREARPWLLAAALAFWLSLGLGHGLFDVLVALPGFGRLRAIGRAQVLVTAFSLAAVMLALERLRSTAVAGAALALVLFEIFPRRPPLRVEAPPPHPVPLARPGPLLVVPAPDATFMVQALEAGITYFGGYSGWSPPGEALLDRLLLRGEVDAAIEFTSATQVLVTDGRVIAGQRRACAQDWCLYEVAPRTGPTLQIARDAQWDAVADRLFLLHARRSGVLDIRDLDRCRVRRTFHWRLLPDIVHDQGLAAQHIAHPRVQAGETLLSLRMDLLLLRTGLAPAVSLESVCR